MTVANFISCRVIRSIRVLSLSPSHAHMAASYTLSESKGVTVISGYIQSDKFDNFLKKNGFSIFFILYFIDVF